MSARETEHGKQEEGMRFRKKPVEIEARQTGPDTAHDVLMWVRGEGGKANFANQGGLIIHTLEGDMYADPGDWIIRGVQGEFYPCKPDIFEATYEAADTDDRQARVDALAEHMREEVDGDALAKVLYDAAGFHSADSWATETDIGRAHYENFARAAMDHLARIAATVAVEWLEGQR